jgi:hypothetical protein
MAGSEITSGVWYDAPEGGDEFFLDGNDTSLGSKLTDTRESDVEEEDEVDEVDEDIGDDDSVESAVEELPASPPQESGVVEPQVAVIRRTRLPAPTSGEEGSLFSVLKKNVGKVCLPLPNRIKIKPKHTSRIFLPCHSQSVSTSRSASFNGTQIQSC